MQRSAIMIIKQFKVNSDYDYKDDVNKKIELEEYEEDVNKGIAVIEDGGAIINMFITSDQSGLLTTTIHYIINNKSKKEAR
ncbi:MAG: hypothetical protein WAQ28_02060 [Bacteroidia bacterium]